MRLTGKQIYTMKRLLILALAVSAAALAAFAQAPQLYANDGTGKYLGNLSANQFDPNSVSNPFGRYGSQFSADSINNPFGVYGSQFSPYSPTNPFTTHAPMIMSPMMPLNVMRPMPIEPLTMPAFSFPPLF